MKIKGILLIIFLILIISIYYFFIKKDSNPHIDLQNITLISSCEKMAESNSIYFPNHEDAAECYIYAAKKYNNLAYCNQASRFKGYSKNGCYISVAVDSENLSICYLIENLTNRGLCFAKIAADTKNISYCYYLQELQDISNVSLVNSCIAGLVRQWSQIPICQNLSDHRFECFKTLVRRNNNVRICTEYLQGDERDECFFIVSTNTMNMTQCVPIQNISIKTSCVNYILSYEDRMLRGKR